MLEGYKLDELPGTTSSCIYNGAHAHTNHLHSCTTIDNDTYRMICISHICTYTCIHMYMHIPNDMHITYMHIYMYIYMYIRGLLKEYQHTTLSSKRTHSIAREHILWWLLKEYQYTTLSAQTRGAMPFLFNSDNKYILITSIY